MKKMILLALVLSCSCRTYIPQASNLTMEDLPAECRDTYNLLKEHWKKHKKKGCHQYFPEIRGIAFSQKSCFSQLKKEQIDDLLGPPDEEIGGSYAYDLCDYPPEYGMRYYLSIAFSDEKVREMDLIIVQSTHTH